jgi:hypothetical protein
LAWRGGLEAVFPFVAGLAALLAALPTVLGLLTGLAVEVPLFPACVFPGADGLVPAFWAALLVERPSFDGSSGLLVLFLPVAFWLADCLLLTVFFVTGLGGWAARSAFPAALPFDAGSDDFFLLFFSSLS